MSDTDSSLLPRPLSRSDGGGASPASLFLFLLLLSLFRVWYAGTHELLQDEAYYWQWARHPDWGYYDNTPLAALVIRLFVSLAGANEIGVRLSSIVSALVASVFIYLLTARLLGQKTAFWAAVLANTVPLYAAGATIATHDPVQLALWAAALYVLHQALHDGKPGQWLVAGVLAGLAAQAKLNALLLLPSVFLYLLLSPPMRKRWLLRPEPYLAGLLALAIFAPFVWWNHTHADAFWTHIHAMGSRSGPRDAPGKWLFRFLGDQALVLSPLLFLTFLYALWNIGRRALKETNDALLFLWCPAVTVFAATVAVALRSKVEANWAVASYVTGLVLVTHVLVRAWETHRGRVWTVTAAAFALLLSGGALFPYALYGVGVKFQNPAKDRTNELYGWRQMAFRIQAERQAMGTHPFVFGVNYRLPSEAAFYLPGQPQTYSLFLHDRANEYMFWEDERTLIGRDAVFVHDSPNPDHVEDLRRVFTRIEPQPPLLVYRNPPYGNVPVRVIQVVRCYGFRGYDVEKWQNGW